jgi:hypothetical protein
LRPLGLLARNRAAPATKSRKRKVYRISFSLQSG